MTRDEALQIQIAEEKVYYQGKPVLIATLGLPQHKEKWVYVVDRHRRPTFSKKVLLGELSRSGPQEN